jgi:galactose mutarotase-like enzyme
VFTIALKQEQYLTYILSDTENHSRVEIVPERGGIVTSWRIQGQDILYLDNERFANPQLSVRGGIPILFPICGNLPDNLYLHNNKQYTLKQHGFARDIPWQVVAQETESCASITLVLKSNNQTRTFYPFDFQLEFTYQLKGSNLKIKQCYINHSGEKMPFSVGFHPYFWTKDKSQLSFNIPASEYHNQITRENYPYKGSFDFVLDEIDAAFTTLSSNSTSMMDSQRHLKVKITYSDLFSTLVFWTVKGKDYVCLEPWSAPRNALNTGVQLNYLEPTGVLEAFVEMNVTYF